MLDACVLFQGRLTNLLLWMAEAHAFEPVWSHEIHDEWSRNLAAAKLGMTHETIAYRKAQMQRAFPAADCDADPSVVLRIRARCRLSRQMKDAHVVATAIAAGASVIVTENLRDFAPDVLAAFSLRAVRPEGFCLALLKTLPEETLAGIKSHRESLVRTPMGPAEYVAYLDKALGLAKLSRALSAHLPSI